MKKCFMVVIFLVFTTTLVLGCSKKPTVVLSELSSDELSSMDTREISNILFKEFKSDLPKLKQAYKEIGIPVEELLNKMPATKNSGVYSLSYVNPEIGGLDTFDVAYSSLNIEPHDDLVISIDSKMHQRVSDSETKKNGFKFEETDFYKIYEIASSVEVDSSEIDKKVNEFYKSGKAMDVILVESANQRLKIGVGYDQIIYELNVLSYSVEPTQ